ncbi:hypothetical protein B9Z19DRAFT_367429 [Tuber borchii]|uniref:Uncharacterized protein n=1 Tax=Tuber borchii TaxID=42251 RepID=A0A2T6ZI48_TUBBO|nr:hypothetical protein B9Z19DRAFT_367429 [Tuber borchii]
MPRRPAPSPSGGDPPQSTADSTGKKRKRGKASTTSPPSSTTADIPKRDKKRSKKGTTSPSPSNPPPPTTDIPKRDSKRSKRSTISPPPSTTADIPKGSSKRSKKGTTSPPPASPPPPPPPAPSFSSLGFHINPRELPKATITNPAKTPDANKPEVAAATTTTTTTSTSLSAMTATVPATPTLAPLEGLAKVLQEVNKVWYQRYQKESERLQDVCRACCAQKDNELKEANEKIKDLQKDRIAVLEGTLNVRGAVDYARDINKLAEKGGLQEGINSLYKTDHEFVRILHEQGVKRGLSRSDVKRCVGGLYHALSKNVHGNNGNILIRKSDFSDNDRAVIVSLMILQQGWPDHHLKWSEE